MADAAKRSAFSVLSESFALDKSNTDAAVLKSSISQLDQQIAGVIAASEKNGSDAAAASAAAAAGVAPNANETKVQQILRLMKQFGGPQGLSAEAQLTTDEMTAWVDDWYATFAALPKDSPVYSILVDTAARKFWENGFATSFASEKGAYEDMVASFRSAIGVDRVLAIATQQISDDMVSVALKGDGSRAKYLQVSQTWITGSTSNGTSTAQGSSNNSGIEQSGGVDFSSNATSQFIFFSTPFIDTVGAYRMTTNYKTWDGKHYSTTTPILPTPRPFVDGDSSTIFDMRNIARVGYADSVQVAGDWYVGSAADYLTFNAGGGNDQAWIGGRPTWFDGGTTNMGMSAQPEMDLADYSMTFDETVPSKPGASAVSKGSIYAVASSGGRWLVRKTGTATLQMLVLKSQTTKVGKDHKIVEYYVTEKSSRPIDAWDILRNVEAVNGTSSNDRFIGAFGRTISMGADGNDQFDNVYNDTVVGGSGNDSVIGGTSKANINEVAKGSLVDGGLGNDSIIMLEGNDTLIGGLGADTISAGAGNDLVFGDATTSAPDGDPAASADRLYGGDGADTILGGYGDDTIEGGFGADRLDGGDGDDFLYGGAGNNLLSGGAGQDSLLADDGADTLNGDEGNDFLCDTGGRNRLFGGGGDDILVGLEAAIVAGSTYDGGSGHDLFSARLVTDSGIVASLTTGADALGNVFTTPGVSLSGRSTGATLVDIENVEGSDQADLITGDAGANILVGRLGNDRLYGMDGIDYLHGGAGADTLYGGDDHDLLVGAEGNDYLVGGDSGDTYAFEGAFGNDVIGTTSSADVSEYAGDVLLFNDTVFTDIVFQDERQALGADVGDLVISVIDKSNPAGNLRSVRVKNLSNVAESQQLVVSASTGDGRQALISTASIMLLASEMAAKGVTAGGFIAYDLLGAVADAQTATWTVQQSA